MARTCCQQDMWKRGAQVRHARGVGAALRARTVALLHAWDHQEGGLRHRCRAAGQGMHAPPGRGVWARMGYRKPAAAVRKAERSGGLYGYAQAQLPNVGSRETP